MEMRCKYNACHAVPDLFVQEGHGHVQIFCAVINAGQDVAMQVYQALAHSSLLSCFVS